MTISSREDETVGWIPPLKIVLVIRAVPVAIYFGAAPKCMLNESEQAEI